MEGGREGGGAPDLGVAIFAEELGIGQAVVVGLAHGLSCREHKEWAHRE